ncbi:hypothetical protein TIFTF001_032707 [Ficus carica]|uniref:Uncharacterized protein n=1 Tax=Ficus carica TaxID=3494 RepID=A0AA88J2Q9_FICCA|nr:hypothetical protein TIFTF001_032707 [Ficus carica]
MQATEEASSDQIPRLLLQAHPSTTPESQPSASRFSDQPNDDDLDEGFGEGAAVDDGLLGAADFGGGDELHGFGDLLDVLHGVDSHPQFSEAAADWRWGSAKFGLDGGADGGSENGH